MVLSDGFEFEVHVDIIWFSKDNFYFLSAERLSMGHWVATRMPMVSPAIIKTMAAIRPGLTPSSD